MVSFHSEVILIQAESSIFLFMVYAIYDFKKPLPNIFHKLP